MGWLGTWAKRKAIKYGTTKPGSSLTDFPLLIQIAADANLGTALGATPKLAFTLADGTTAVNHGRISWSYSGGAITANIRAKFSPTSSANTGDVIGYIYYDSTQTDTQNKAGVLDSYTLAYWPLEENPTGSANDIESWVSGTNGTSHGSMASAVAGQVGNADTFDGSNDYITTPVTNTLNDFTCSVIFKNSTYVAVAKRLIDKSYNTGFWMGESSSGSTNTWGGGVLESSAPYGRFVTLSANAFHQLVSRRSGTTHTIIGDGGSVSATGTVSATALDATAVVIGADLQGGSYFDFTNCIIDEARIDSVARSADWIAYDYQNQFNNSNTVTLGTEESMPASGVIGPVLQGRVISPGRIFGGSLLQ